MRLGALTSGSKKRRAPPQARKAANAGNDLVVAGFVEAARINAEIPETDRILRVEALRCEIQ
jgi:hypothetical protein